MLQRLVPAAKALLLNVLHTQSSRTAHMLVQRPFCCVCSESLPLLLQMQSLGPSTHAYSFWQGMNDCGKSAFGALFAASNTLRSVAVVQNDPRWGISS